MNENRQSSIKNQLEAPSGAVDPERDLWRAVLSQVLADALYRHVPGRLRMERLRVIRPEMQRYHDAGRARLWFTVAGCDYCMVCDLADIDADAMREMALAEIAAFDERVTVVVPVPRRIPKPPLDEAPNPRNRSLTAWSKA